MRNVEHLRKADGPKDEDVLSQIEAIARHQIEKMRVASDGDFVLDLDHARALEVYQRLIIVARKNADAEDPLKGKTAAELEAMLHEEVQR